MAAGDPPDTPVHRYGVIDQKSQDAVSGVQQVVAKEGVRKVLVGMPISLEGNETEQTHKTLVFMEKLREVLPDEVEVEGVDETLTSVEAQRVLRHEGSDPDEEHAEAARLMLQDFLNQSGNLF